MQRRFEPISKRDARAQLGKALSKYRGPIKRLPLGPAWNEGDKLDEHRPSKAAPRPRRR